jgi:hypothetical protein
MPLVRTSTSIFEISGKKIDPSLICREETGVGTKTAMDLYWSNIYRFYILKSHVIHRNKSDSSSQLH